MKAMVLNHIGDVLQNKEPLDLTEIPLPKPEAGQVLLRVSTCGVCHTELDEIEGRTVPPFLPIVPGHQVVGRIEALGQHVTGYSVGDRVGVAWIYSACGRCAFCLRGQENLCSDFRATGRDVNGGYAEYMVAPADFIFAIPETFYDAEAAPLLCAGAIGYRSLRLSNLQDGQPLGLTGFGSSAHLVLKMVRHRYPKSEVFVFARNPREREFALDLGAVWAGGITDRAPERLAAIIDTTPAWKPVVEALENLRPGGRLVINAIRKEEIEKESLLTLDYERHMWMEKEIKSVANVTRRDVSEFLELAADSGLRPEFQEFALDEANQALVELKKSKIRGAKILRMI